MSIVDRIVKRIDKSFLEFIKQQFVANCTICNYPAGFLTYNFSQQSSLEINLTSFKVSIVFEVSNFGEL